MAILSPNAYRAHLQKEPLGANPDALQHAGVSSQMNLQKINSSAILATFSAGWSREHQRNKYKMTKIILTSIAHPDWILNCFWARITFCPESGQFLPRKFLSFCGVSCQCISKILTQSGKNNDKLAQIQLYTDNFRAASDSCCIPATCSFQASYLIEAGDHQPTRVWSSLRSLWVWWGCTVNILSYSTNSSKISLSLFPIWYCFPNCFDIEVRSAAITLWKM